MYCKVRCWVPFLFCSVGFKQSPQENAFYLYFCIHTISLLFTAITRFVCEGKMQVSMVVLSSPGNDHLLSLMSSTVHRVHSSHLCDRSSVHSARVLESMERVPIATAMPWTTTELDAIVRYVFQ
jgi:hypothetical protein